jgi:hypothetical protein
MSARVLIVLVAASVALAGCGLHDPYSTPRNPAGTTTAATATATAPTTTSQQGDPAPERGGTIPQAVARQQTTLAAGAGQRTPRAALARYARLYLNWTAATVPSVQRQLVGVSLGQARAQALDAAAATARDPLLSRSHVANSGELVAVAAGEGPATGEWVLVTSEHTTGTGTYAGLPATLHVIYATVTHSHVGWVVSSWKPRG